MSIKSTRIKLNQYPVAETAGAQWLRGPILDLDHLNLQTDSTITNYVMLGEMAHPFEGSTSSSITWHNNCIQVMELFSRINCYFLSHRVSAWFVTHYILLAITLMFGQNEP